MSQKPSLIIVPGAWQTPEYWGKVISAMEAKGFKCIPVTLPTSQSTSTEINFSHDVKAISEAIESETSLGLDVVLLCHSLGGRSAESAMKGLTLKSDETNAKAGHVIGLVLIAAGFAREGISFLDGLDGKVPPTVEADYENNTISMKVDPIDLLYHDLPEEEAKQWVAKHTHFTLTSVSEGYEVVYEGWRDVPVWYIMTKDDRNFPFEAQKMLIRGAEKAGADVTKREIESSHCPMLSRPDEVVGHLEEAIQAFTT
ncbi:alpha beta-hydrolase [Fusarium beomiforme]|uniref:Alpha beta-hydrolase n=1 Tax=Fusarium beomiforme TaxID=44412 RepID=A0A9P5E174_9HYPO|nr:alpha beta-hydrolase [Fusarium beomiforme]